MAKASQTSRSSARVVQLRKGTTVEMVRLACPDAAQMTLIAESFGLPVLDSDGIRDQHERLIVETATAVVGYRDDFDFKAWHARWEGALPSNDA